MKRTFKHIAIFSFILVLGVLLLTGCVPQSTTDDNTNKCAHVEVVDEAVAPTCTTSGRTKGSHCSLCGEILVAQQVKAAYGHKEVDDLGYAPTCTTDGLTDGKHCTVCSEVFIESNVIPALGHTKVTDHGYAATCTADGLTDGSHCSVCNTVFVAQTVIPAAHTYGEWVVTDPTEDADGLKTRECSYCGDVESEIIESLTHDHSKWAVTTLSAVAPTCTETGLTEGQQCSKCLEILVAQTVVPATGHTYTHTAVAPTCTADGYTVHACACGDSYTDAPVDALGHVEVILSAVNPTCLKDGKTEGKQCSRCKEIYVAQETVPATGHTEIDVPATAPTCTAAGRTAGKKCTVCGISTQQSVPKLGHNDVTVPLKDPTCTEIGWYEYTACTRCNRTTGYYERAALGHNEVNTPTVQPTCTSNGTVGGKHCSRCNTVLVQPDLLDSLGGHTYALGLMPSTSGIYAPVCTKCSELKPMSVITYADYGAVGDGKTDDSEAIRKAHNAANYLRLPVEGSAGATYYIGAITKTITIKTDTDWKGAKFIFDDSTIRWDNATLRSVHVFTVEHDDKYLYYDVAVPEALKKNGLKAGQANIGMTFDGPCMLLIENSNEKIFKRYGVNQDNGDNKQEVIYVDANGNVIGTPIQYDYSTITSIKMYSVDDTPITVGNASIVTIVPNPKAQDPNYENNYCFFNRGILVRRSNTTLYNIIHTIEGEDMSVIIDRDGDGKTGDAKNADGLPEKWTDDKSYGVPYSGFFVFEYSYNVKLDTCQVQGHQAYNFYQSGGRNEMGSYDISAKYCIGLQFLSVAQRENYGEYASDTVITNRFMYHGIMGSYYCRNIVMDNCYLDRFDSHKGMHSATITNSTLGFGILVIGGGELYIENVYRVSEGTFILLREDYNSIFDGNITIKDCRMGPTVTSIITGSWRSYETGLPNYMVRSLTIDGLVVETTGGYGSFSTYKIYLFNIGGASKTSTSDSLNPVILPTSVTYANVTTSKVSGSGYGKLQVNASKNSGDAFSTVTVTQK